MIINDLDGYYIVFDTKNWNTELDTLAKVSIQKDIISNAKRQICKYVEEYIESLPYKVDDKISCIRCDICWISSIRPNGSTGFVEVRINPAKKDGTRSNREFVLRSMEIDSIKKIS